jgi:putative transposase
MPYRRIDFVEGEYYHVFNRGALKATVFYDDECYDSFVRLITLYADQTGVTVFVMCLMPNHFHMLVRQEVGGDISKFMKLLCATYSRTLNEKLRRVGTIWQGRFGACHVDSNEYLLHLCRYIHANPVKAGLVRGASDWTYSNFEECMGRRDYLPFVAGFIEGLFSSLPLYQETVESASTESIIRHKQLARDLAAMRIV